MTASSTTRCEGSSSGKPLSGVTRLISQPLRASPYASAKPPGSLRDFDFAGTPHLGADAPAMLAHSCQLPKKRVGRAFHPDCGRLTVSRIDHRVVGHWQDDGLQRMQHLVHRATGQIDPADRTGEDEVTGEDKRVLVIVG